MNFYFINKLLNPTLLEPISEFFDDKNYVMINQQYAIDTNLFIREYEVETDESLWPWTNISTEKGLFLDWSEK